MIVRPARNVRGSVSLPGDKSISHRYAMLAAIAEGPSRLENYSTGADCASTLGCLRSLGVKWERRDGGRQHHRSAGQRAVIDRPERSAGLRQLRIDHPHVERHCGGANILQRNGWR